MDLYIFCIICRITVGWFSDSALPIIVTKLNAKLYRKATWSWHIHFKIVVYLFVSVAPPALLGIWREVVRPHAISSVWYWVVTNAKSEDTTHKKSIFLQWPSAVESRKTHNFSSHSHTNRAASKISDFSNFASYRTVSIFANKICGKINCASTKANTTAQSNYSQPKHSWCWVIWFCAGWNAMGLNFY